MREPFYHATTKKVILAFSTIFDEIRIIDGFGREQTVPLHFSQKEKFLDDIQKGVEYNQDATNIDVVFPRIGFEFTGMNFAPERHTNPMNTIEATRPDGITLTMYNRVAYDLSFDVFIGARKIEDALKVVEQIISFFNPGLILIVKDMNDYEDETNLTFVLNSVSHNIDYEGSLDSRRTVLWTLNFTAKAYYYVDVQQATLIKQTIIDFRHKDLDTMLAKYISTVDPIQANRDDPHTIIDEEIIGEIPEP